MFHLKTQQVVMLCIALLTGASTKSFADFEFGIQYYANKQYDKAYQEFLEAAQYGDYDAQFNLGAMYYRGEHITKDIPTAYAWMALAAQNHNYKEKAVHTKIYEKLNDLEKKSADEKYHELFNLYNDDAITNKLNPIFVSASASVQDERPIKKVLPKYPTDMLREGKSGIVDMLFTVDKDGSTKDHLVYFSTSKSFETAAIDAARKFRYEPLMVNGKIANVNGVKNRFIFEIEGSKYSKAKLKKMIAELKEKAQTGDAKDKLGYAYFLEVVPTWTHDYKPEDNPNEWYVKSANQGSAAASYFLGRNILYGNMCTQNNTQSMGWLLKSAKEGISDAQYMLAIESLSGARFEKNEDKAFYWLKKAAENSKAAKIRYSWILATHPLSEKRNAKLAMDYISSIDDDYYDKQSLYQTRAAVAAENGDFKNAVKWQKKTIEDASDLGLPLDIAQQKLAAYENNKPWREEL